MCSDLKVKYPLFLSDCNLNFPDRFSKNTEISEVMKIRAVGAELFQADRHEANSRFSQFCERA